MPKKTVKVIDKGFDDFVVSLEHFKRFTVATGIFENAADQPKLSRVKGVDVVKDDAPPLALVAAVLEFGSEDGKIPPRPAVRQALRKSRPEYIKRMRKLYVRSTKQRLQAATIKKSLDSVGKLITKEIKKSITNLQEPALSDSTLKARERNDAGDNPLVITGQLRDAYTSKVIIKKKRD